MGKRNKNESEKEGIIEDFYIHNDGRGGFWVVITKVFPGNYHKKIVGKIDKIGEGKYRERVICEYYF